MKTQDRLQSAIEDSSFPCNPIPFAQGLADFMRDNDTSAIRSNEAQRILWILMAQSYGQMATIDLCDEWERLTNNT
jgi:hypothetical protein